MFRSGDLRFDNVDLGGPRFRGVGLAGADVRGVDLRHVRMRGVEMSGGVIDGDVASLTSTTSRSDR